MLKSVQVMYAVEEDRHFKGKINIYSRMHLLVNIDNRLSESHWKRLMDSPLGGVARLGTRVQFSGQLVHYVFQRQLKTKKANETWYKIHDAVVRFSIAEFALVTSLNCGYGEEPKDDAPFEKAVFDFFGVSKMKMSEFEVQFRVAMASEKSSTRKLKFVLLMLVEGVLFGKEPKNYIHGWVVDLVGDIDRFLVFPWGRLCYERTNEFLNRAIERKLQRDEGNSNARPAYCLSGFPLAFQVRTQISLDAYTRLLGV